MHQHSSRWSTLQGGHSVGVALAFARTAATMYQACHQVHFLLAALTHT